MNKSIVLVLLSLFLSIAQTTGSIAQEQPVENQATEKKSSVITIETATIRGNQELPTVLYLVPWQAPKINPLPASQTADLTKQAPEKLERNSFLRLLHYHQQFKSMNE